MTTENTKIKDFQINDTFLFYGAKFRVLDECMTFNERNGEFYGRHCEMIENLCPHWSTSGLLKDYTWMQGTDNVTYAKIIDK